jgi:hypothetical protein
VASFENLREQPFPVKVYLQKNAIILMASGEKARLLAWFRFFLDASFSRLKITCLPQEEEEQD